MNGATVGSNREGRAYRGYVLGILGVVSLLNYYDRNLISILVEPIKHDLKLTDSDIGFLSGFGFALMYSLLGVPMAQLADRYGRAKTLAAVLAVWSLMTMLSGRAQGYVSMLLARIGVGVGEAGGLPATHALIADYFPSATRGKALSVIGICAALGLSLALGAGGLISERYGWRTSFYLGALPGLLLAVVLALTVRERHAVSASGEQAVAPPLHVAFAKLRARRAFVYFCAGVACACIGAYGQQAWTPAFLMRSYQMSTGSVGGYYSAVVGPATLVSVFVGGVLNDWLLKRDKRWSLWILAACFGVTVPASFVLYLVHDFSLAMIMSVLVTLAGGLWVAPAYALVQSLAGPTMRALAAAIFMMIVNIVGLGLGPYLTGVLSDHLAPAYGGVSLAISLCLVTITCGIGAVVLILGNRSIESDLETAAAD